MPTPLLRRVVPLVQDFHTIRRAAGPTQTDGVACFVGSRHFGTDRKKSDCDCSHLNTERMCFVKKIVALMLLAGFLVVGVVGCGATTSAPKAGSPPSSKPPADKPQE